MVEGEPEDQFQERWKGVFVESHSLVSQKRYVGYRPANADGKLNLLEAGADGNSGLFVGGLCAIWASKEVGLSWEGANDTESKHTLRLVETIRGDFGSEMERWSAKRMERTLSRWQTICAIWGARNGGRDLTFDVCCG